MTRSSALKAPNSVAISLDDTFNAVTRAIKSGNHSSALSAFETLGRIRDQDALKQISEKLLPLATAQINQTISARFEGKHGLSNGQINRIWKSLEQKRETYSRVFAFACSHAEKHHLPVSEQTAVQAHLPLLTGPEKFSRPLSSQLKLLDGQLEFSPAFIEYEKGIRKSIARELEKLGVADVVRGRDQRNHLSVQTICDVVTRHYGLASVPISTATGDNPQTAFMVGRREITIREDQFLKLSNELKVGVILHEARHAIQLNLIDNMLHQRRDGSPSHYAHRSRHEIVRTFPRDVERFFISSIARGVSSQLIVMTNEAGQALYGSLSSEKDADSFAANILALLLKKDTDSIVAEYRQAMTQDKSAGKAVETTTAASPSPALHGSKSSLVIPSTENSWDSGAFRESLLENLFPKQPASAEKKSVDLALTGIAQKASENSSTSALLQRDPELYRRNEKTLAYQATMADFSTPAEIRSALPRLRALAQDPLCGTNGLQILRKMVVKALDGTLELNRELKEELQEVRNSLRFLKSADSEKRETKAQIIRALTSRTSVEVPEGYLGTKETLWDSCENMRRAFNRGKYLEVANGIKVIEKQIDGGWLGERPKRVAIEIVNDVINRLDTVTQLDVRGMLKIRLKQVVTDIKESRV